MRGLWEKTCSEQGGRSVSDQRTLHHLDGVQEQLTQAVTEPLLREACTRLWYWREARPHMRGPKCAQVAQVVVMEQVICQRLCPEWPLAYERVEQILGQVVRASS